MRERHLYEIKIRRSFRARSSARTRALSKEPILNDISNKAERLAVSTATKQHDLLRPPATQWWRLTPATAFNVVALLEMRASLSKIDMLGERAGKTPRRSMHRRRSASRLT